jgi:hypothetical protein
MSFWVNKIFSLKFAKFFSHIWVIFYFLKQEMIFGLFQKIFKKSNNCNLVILELLRVNLKNLRRKWHILGVCLRM